MGESRTRGCVICGNILTGRRKKYCSSECQKLKARADWLMNVYGITTEEYNEILRYQDFRCAICRKTAKPGTSLHVDHEHGGHVRGLLCGYCNLRLVGRLKDHDKAQRLADYLRDPPAVRVVGEVVAPGRPKKRRQPRKKIR